MSISQTHGYHLVFELSNNRLAGIVDDFIPNPVSFTIPGGIDVTASKIPGRPSTVSIASGNNITVNAVRQVQILTSQINVRITIQAQLSVSGGQVTITYPSAPVITADTPADQTHLQSLVALANALQGTNLTVAQVLQMGAQSLLGTLQTGFTLPNIPVGVPFNPGPCALSLSRIDLHTITNSIFVLLQFSGAGVPAVALNANGFTTSLRGGSESVMVVANDALLAIAACFIGQDPASPLHGAPFVTSGNTTTMVGFKNVSLDGHDLLITGLTISVVGNQLVVSGSGSTSGTGYDASATFSAPIGFNCHADGTIFPVFDPNSVAINVSVSFDWWVYLVGFAIAAIAGVILGPLVGVVLSIVVALLGPIASLVGNAIAKNALSGLSQSLNNSISQGYQMAPPALLQVLGELRCQQVILDDFAMQGFMNPHSKPDVYISEDDVVTDKAQTDTGGTGIFGQYVDYNTATKATFTANASLFKLPVVITWYIGGTHVMGSGSMTLNGKTIHYTVAGNKCTIQTNLGDAVTGVITAKATGQDNFGKFDTALIDIPGTLRDYPGQDALRAILDKVSHIAVVQGWPFNINSPDPAPYYQRQIDMGANYQQALLASSAIRGAGGIIGKGGLAGGIAGGIHE